MVLLDAHPISRVIAIRPNNLAERTGAITNSFGFRVDFMSDVGDVITFRMERAGFCDELQFSQ